MKVLSLGIGTQLFDEKSSLRSRILKHGAFCDELHVVVYTSPGFKSIKIGSNIRVYPTNTKYKALYFLEAYRLSGKIIKDGGRFIITSQEGLTHFLALALSFRFGLGVEMQIHTDIFSKFYRRESLMNNLRLLGFWLCAKRARSIRVVSKRIALGLRQRWHIPGHKISILPVYVDKLQWQRPRTKDALHSRYPQYSHIILMASRLTREKNIPLALKVFSKVLQRYPRAGLVVVGDGPMKHAVGGKNVEYLSWSDNMAEMYQGADVFLLTSDYEGYGLTLVEAALSGLPIVTTDVGVVGSLLTPHNALIAPPRDSDKLAAHIMFLLQNKEARVMMCGRLRKVGESLPDTEVYYKLFKNSWIKCLNSPK